MSQAHDRLMPSAGPARPEAPPDLDILETPFEGVIDEAVAEILATTRRSPVLTSTDSASLRSRLPPDLPREGAGLDAALDEVKRTAGAFLRRNAHPGFFGFVASPGLPTDPLAHAVTAAYNQNVVGYAGSPGAATVERAVVGWLCALAGLPEGAGGVLVGGGSGANTSALAAALYRAVGDGALEEGLTNLPRRPVIAAADSAHFSVQRAAVQLGIGRAHVRRVPVDSQRRMDVDELERVLDDVERRGECCVAVVASAGSTTTGTIDPLAAIARVCRRRGLWLHVDAAYGGAGLLAPALRDKFDGIEGANSITMDLHKWFYLAFDGSVVLYRNPDDARRVYFESADYAQYGRDEPPERQAFFHLGPEVSRRSRAIAPYLAWRTYGTETLGRFVAYNAACARYLAGLVEATPELELVSSPDLSILCYRYVPAVDLAPGEVDTLNEAIRERLLAEGDFYLSATNVDGCAVLRVCICSHTTRAEHVEQLVDRTLSLGRELGS